MELATSTTPDDGLLDSGLRRNDGGGWSESREENYGWLKWVGEIVESTNLLTAIFCFAKACARRGAYAPDRDCGLGETATSSVGASTVHSNTIPPAPSEPLGEASALAEA